MKRIISILAALFVAFGLIFSYNIVVSFAQTIDLSAKSSVLIEATTGRVLYQNNAYEKKPMASTTKIMTAIVALEYGNVEDTVVVSQNASGIEGSSIWLSAGEKMSLSDMLFGLMLASGNDAAIAVAEHVGGSVEAFVELMNQTAQRIGAYNTHFMNPNGLPSDDHYTTAYDLALISAYAMQNDYFCEIVKTQYKKLPWEGHEWERVVKNKNRILWNYDGGNGIKTGYTKAAGKCLAAAAQRNGMQLVAVALDAPNMFEDCMKLMNHGFENYQNRLILCAEERVGDVAVEQGTEESFTVYTDQDIYYPLTEDEYAQIEKRVYLEESVRAPVRYNDKVGCVDIWLSGSKIGSAILRAPVSIRENSYGFNLKRLIDFWLNTRVLEF